MTALRAPCGAPRLDARPALRRSCRKPLVCCAAAQQRVSGLAQKLASAGAAAMLLAGSLSGVPPALAGEFDVLGEAKPSTYYYVDDASVLSKASRSEINQKLKLLEVQTGYRISVVTVRKLEFETDAFAFADKVLENWYTAAEGEDKGLVLVVTSSKEGAVTGGPGFVSAVGEELVDAIISENIPIFSEEEKYNAAVLSTVERLEAKLSGKPVPAGPKRNDANRERTYRTREETDKSKNVTTTVVVSLLLIAVIVPMLQYYGYTAKD